MTVKKRFIPIFVAVLMVFTMMPIMAGTTYAEIIESKGLLYDLNSNEALFMGISDENGTAFNRTEGTLTIDGMIRFKRVIIRGNALESLPSGIHKVIIRKGVAEIRDFAFEHCSGLVSVSLPASLETLGRYAFANCLDLETVSFAANSRLRIIASAAFYNCLNLKEVTIPSSVTRIEEDAFNGCDELTTIHYGGSREQWEAIQGNGKPSIDLVEFNYPIAKEIKANGTSIKNLKSAKKAITVKWIKQPAKVKGSHITGYQIRLATNRKFTRNKKTVTVKGYKTVSKKIRNLKSKKKYYVKIRTYKSVDGEKYYSPWSKAKSVKTR